MGLVLMIEKEMWRPGRSAARARKNHGGDLGVLREVEIESRSGITGIDIGTVIEIEIVTIMEAGTGTERERGETEMAGRIEKEVGVEIGTETVKEILEDEVGAGTENEIVIEDNCCTGIGSYFDSLVLMGVHVYLFVSELFSEVVAVLHENMQFKLLTCS